MLPEFWRIENRCRKNRDARGLYGLAGIFVPSLLESVHGRIRHPKLFSRFTGWCTRHVNRKLPQRRMGQKWRRQMFWHSVSGSTRHLS